MEDPEWEPHDVAPEEQGGGGGREPAASSADEPPSSEWECNICFEALKIEESCITSCGRKQLRPPGRERERERATFCFFA